MEICEEKKCCSFQRIEVFFFLSVLEKIYNVRDRRSRPVIATGIHTNGYN